MANVTAAFRGVSTPVHELVRLIEEQGWEPGKIGFSNGEYVASASHQGEKVERGGPDQSTALANVLKVIVRKHHIRSQVQQHLGMGKAEHVERMEEIASEYAKAPMYDPKAAPAWKELADDSTRRQETLSQQITVEYTDDPFPYASAKELREDVQEKKHLTVTTANSEHPLWTLEQVLAFRVVHDVMGYTVAGADFGWHGENMAFEAHRQLLSNTAQKALFTETIGQVAVTTHFGMLPAIKVTFLESFGEPPRHPGHHPSQTVAPVKHVHAAVQQIDPNHAWSSGAEPHPQNAYLWHGDPMESQAVMDNARLVDTGWSQFKREDGTPDADRMKQAIVNAFRVVLLSPRKDLRWNAVHYQDIASVPATVTDPKVYWDTLETKRRQWNQAQGIDPNAHMVYYKFLKPFEAIILQRNPELGHEGAHEKAEAVLYEWWAQEQQRIEQEDADKPPEKQRNADEIERRANEALARRLQTYIKDQFNPQTDVESVAEQPSLFASTRWHVEAAGEQYNLMTGEAAGKYGAFMGTHLKAISQVSQHADELLQAALQDVQEHDGTGHHFRAKVLQLEVPGVGPKVASFAWLLLQPMTSQLGTIDTHMMDVLGHDYDKEMNNRDYFKFERELAAGRDAAGYGHVPLGTFQWGMWDYKRTGPGTHQDHSAMRVLDPVPHTQIDWASKALNLKGDSWHQQAPQWWTDTLPHRQQVAEDWDQNVAPNFGRGKIPYQQADSNTLRTAKAKPRTGPIPWYQSPDGSMWTGYPGQSYAHMIRQVHGTPAHEYWQQEEQGMMGKYDPERNHMIVAQGNGDQVAAYQYLTALHAPPEATTPPTPAPDPLQPFQALRRA
jgi:hypothetical protein